jgi:hypothetical protein
MNLWRRVRVRSRFVVGVEDGVVDWNRGSFEGRKKVERVKVEEMEEGEKSEGAEWWHYIIFSKELEGYIGIRRGK